MKILNTRVCVCVRDRERQERQSTREGCTLIGEKIRNLVSTPSLLANRTEQNTQRLNKSGENETSKFGKKPKYSHHINKEGLANFEHRKIGKLLKSILMSSCT